MKGPGVRSWVSLAVSLAVILGSLVWPWVGLAVPLLVVIAVLGNFLQPKWFCRKACPRAGILGGFVGRWARFQPLPPAFHSQPVRNLLCGFLLVCSVGQTARLWERWEALGWFFWAVCAGTLAVALVLGYLYKPRAWCAVCPVGTLQQTLSR